MEQKNKRKLKLDMVNIIEKLEINNYLNYKGLLRKKKKEKSPIY